MSASLISFFVVTLCRHRHISSDFLPATPTCSKNANLEGAESEGSELGEMEFEQGELEF